MQYPVLCLFYTFVFVFQLIKHFLSFRTRPLQFVMETEAQWKDKRLHSLVEEICEPVDHFGFIW